MDSYQKYSSMMQYIYFEEQNFHDPSLDLLTNAEYTTRMAEPSYTVVVSLIKVVPPDCIREILQYMFYKDFASDLSARTVRRLHQSVLDKDFPRFKFIYDNEYMQSTISNWFEYDDSPHYHEWNFYPLCDCFDDLAKIHRHLFVNRCFCIYGKRYLAYKMVNEESSLIKTEETEVCKQIKDYIIASGPILINHQPFKICDEWKSAVRYADLP
jgi:hypothetical protein